MKKFTYLIGWGSTREKGRITVVRDKPIESQADVENVEMALRKESGDASVVVVGVFPLIK